MLHAYRLVYPENPHALPYLWEFEQPYIDRLIRNAQTFNRRVVQRYFRSWAALARENARLWQRYYLPSPLYQPYETWERWLPEYRTLIVEVAGDC
jgi:hypothetical protein